MNVREDKMTFYWGPQIGKQSVNHGINVSFRVTRRAKRGNISPDVVKWVV